MTTAVRSSLAFRCAARFAGARRGNVMIMFAAAGGVLSLVSIVAIDFARIESARGHLQAAADAAALQRVITLGVPEAAGGGRDPADPDAPAEAVFASNIGAGANLTGAQVSFAPVPGDDRTIRADATATLPMFGLALTGRESLDLTATATASLSPGPAVCLFLFGQRARIAAFTGEAQIEAEGCIVHSNSTHNQALTFQDSAEINSQGICVVGNIRGTVGGASRSVQTGCPPLVHPDPRLPPATPGGCDRTNITVPPGTVLEIANESVFCGKMVVEGTLRLGAGVHYFHDIDLEVNGDGRLEGERVLLMFTGNNPKVTFQGAANVTLSADGEGEYAGLVIARPRVNTAQAFSIKNEAFVDLVGAIFTPTWPFHIENEARVGARSDFIAIMADDVDIHNTAVVRLATDHVAAGMPDILPRPYMTPRLIE